MRISAALPTGVEALFFASARRRRRLEARLVRALESEGYEEVILPVVDYLEPYQELLSAGSREELYRFVDRGGDLLALRGDFTPMLARLLAPRLAGLELPLKLFYRGDVLRYQEARAGRQREFYQVGAEVLGLEGEEAALAVLGTFLGLLRTLGSGEVNVVLGFAGALDELLLGASADPLALAHAVVRRERLAARAGGEALLQVVEEGVPADPSSLGERAAVLLGSLESLRGSLARRFPEIRLTIDLAEFADQALAPELQRRVGPRAYYDGLVFRAYTGAKGEPIAGGGRYDRLFHQLGAEVSAAGFSFSLGHWMRDGAEEAGA